MYKLQAHFKNRKKLPEATALYTAFKYQQHARKTNFYKKSSNVLRFRLYSVKVKAQNSIKTFLLLLTAASLSRFRHNVRLQVISLYKNNFVFSFLIFSRICKTHGGSRFSIYAYIVNSRTIKHDVYRCERCFFLPNL